MTFNVLITGASDYLGGTLLARWHASQLSGYDKLYAFIRKPEQAEIVQQKYGAEPIQISLEDEGAVQEEIVSKRINLAFFLIDSYNLQSQTSFIKALSALKTQTGLDVHFIYTSGTKQFSSLSGAPNDQPRKTQTRSFTTSRRPQRPQWKKCK